ncbi:hypothetical protein [Streptomyces sp. NPDC093707]|uniref:hypothetical protein n=1 Tax=Streptomyces sp. NPDC093707 TaxID=3154984 RepID=UPI00344B178F
MRALRIQRPQHQPNNCPECHAAEQALGPAMRALANQGAYRIEYRLATTADGSVRDKPAFHAINALGAAANADAEAGAGGAGKFTGYLNLLLGAPSPSDESLLTLADKVEGLRIPVFDTAVRKLTYLPWTVKVARAHRAESQKFPVVELDGTALTLYGRDGRLLAPETFVQHVRERL